jgi:hypothetical protein
MKKILKISDTLHRNTLLRLGRLYEGREDQDGPIKFGLYAAFYQLTAALTAPYYLASILFGVVVAFLGGLAVWESPEARIAIWGGTVTVCISVILGSVISIIYGDGFGVPKHVRLRAWIATTLVFVVVPYLALEPLGAIDEVWLICTAVLAVVVILITEFHFGDRWHFDQFQSRLVSETLVNYIPREMRGKIIRMNAIDKYTFVLTERGAVEIRMSLSRAIELCDEPGVRVHRSYWVAREYIQRPFKEGRKWYMEVEGELVPVSASHYNDVIGYIQFDYVPTADADRRLETQP